MTTNLGPAEILGREHLPFTAWSGTWFVPSKRMFTTHGATLLAAVATV